VVVRLFAALIVLGLVASSLLAPSQATPAAAALVDSIDDGTDVELLAVATPGARDMRPEIAVVPTARPPLYDHPLFVFKPPRAYAFN
jgi:hypothetical protein